ncbi:putative D,D-dipeptide-binding periplasmic protein DdpA [Acaryochloris thomasi RCC1774]|uniref:Putative D,D-dipeptide-binding periplasmic protein DdpA n=2 Tax=Acaryochloris TaxID=155977 RepID=A0A2W1K0D7_9CYAN|nr:putative D,D-dipeptide-binding periplasmic protein DdpA [Acaryochloris thomasi RCC1774]
MVVTVGCRQWFSSAPTPSPTPTPSTSPPAITSTLTLGTTAKIRTLDPADAYKVFTGNLLYNLGDRLYTYKEGELVPQLATAMPEVSEDGLEYQIDLRQDVVFHDGTPFDAKAMAFSLQRFIDNGGQPSFLLSDTVEKVDEIASHKLKIRLKKPFVAFPALLAFSGLTPVSPQAYTDQVETFRRSTFVGTGPYRLTSDTLDNLKLTPFDQYWGDPPENKSVTVKRYNNAASLYNAFRSGLVDIAYQSLNPDQIGVLVSTAEQTGDWQTITGPGSNITYLSLNLRDPPLNKIEVRQAIALVIDRQSLQNRISRDQVEPLYSLIPSIYPESKSVFRTAADINPAAQAKERLRAGGYSKSKSIKLTLGYRSNVPSDAPAAQAIKSSIERQLDGLVTVDLESMDSAQAYISQNQGRYNLFMLDYTGDFYDPDTYIQPFLACSKGSEEEGCQTGATVVQGSFYYRERMNQLIDQERQSQDPQERQKIFAEIQDIVAEDVPYIPLWQRREYAFAQDNVKGIRLEPTQHLPFWPLKKS